MARCTRSCSRSWGAAPYACSASRAAAASAVGNVSAMACSTGSITGLARRLFDSSRLARRLAWSSPRGPQRPVASIDTWPGQRQGGSSVRFYSEFHSGRRLRPNGRWRSKQRPYGVPARSGVCGLPSAGRSERKAECFELRGPYGAPARSGVGPAGRGTSERKAECFEPCGPFRVPARSAGRSEQRLYGVPARSVNPQAPLYIR